MNLNKFNMSTRIKIFAIAVCVIVSGQIVYSIKNVQSFQASYLETLQQKSRNLGGYLKSDVEYVLNLKIPITKLIKLEKTLKEILNAAPELEFVEIMDLEGYVLYYADHKSMGRVEPGTRKSQTLDLDANRRLEKLKLKAADTDIQLPVYYKLQKRHVGYINMRLSPELVVGKSREILLDMITVILTSLLLTFEFLTFFAAYSISDPLENVVQDIRHSVYGSTTVTGANFLFMKELGQVVERFNHFMNRFLGRVTPYLSLRDELHRIKGKLDSSMASQIDTIQHLESRQASDFFFPKSMALSSILAQLKSALIELRLRVDVMAEHLAPSVFSTVPEEIRVRVEETKGQVRLVPYTYIRPIIFLFLMADGFCASFLPMYVETLYEPLAGLSKEVVVGLPISIFMATLAITMPVSGGWSDATGWFKPLMIGSIINAIGLLLTSLSVNFYQLIFFRCITAIGFGMVFMAGQQFIIDNTSAKFRTLGMASFIAAFFSGDICGTVIGGMLANRIGYRNVFMVSAIISFITFVSVLVIFGKEARKSRKATKKFRFPLRGIFQVLRDREFFAAVFFQAIPAKVVLIGFLMYLVPLYLNSIGTIQSNIGRVFICYGLALVFLGPFFSKFFDKVWLRKYYIFTGGVITGFSLLVFRFTEGFFPIVFIVVMLGVAHTFSVSSLASMISETRIVKKLGPGTGMGLFRFWERAGNVAGPIVVGAFIAKFGYSVSIAYLGYMSLICSMIYLLLIILFSRKKG